MDILNDTLNIISQSSEPTAEWLAEAARDYPYFMLPALLRLEQTGIDSDTDLLARLAIAWPDRKALAMRLGVNAAVFSDFYPPQNADATPDTDTTIDRFLDNYGNTSDKEIEALSNAIFSPTPDYADILAAQECDGGRRADAASDSQSADDKLISDFIEQSRQKKREAAASVPTSQHVDPAAAAEVAHLPIAEPASQDESMLSESLAKMYVSRGKYSKALEIIENINLKFPEKSIYFADQIRFLRKLVLNEKLTKQK